MSREIVYDKDQAAEVGEALEIMSKPHGYERGNYYIDKNEIAVVKQTLTAQSRELEGGKVKEVYIIMSPGGGIGLDISSGHGKCYTDFEEAKKALESKNEWSKPRGYGVYELVTLGAE